MRLYLARHGETSYNRKQRTQGHYDARLTPNGKEQARRLRNHLQDQDFKAVYASTLLRSYQTAQIVAAPHGIRPTAIRDLREVDRGIATGFTYSETEQAIEEEDESVLETFDRENERYRPKYGEDHHELQERVVPAIERLIRRNDSDVLIVAHGWVNRVYLAHCRDIAVADAGEIPQDNCCLNVIETATGTVEVENYTEHLQQ